MGPDDGRGRRSTLGDGSLVQPSYPPMGRWSMSGPLTSLQVGNWNLHGLHGDSNTGESCHRPCSAHGTSSCRSSPDLGRRWSRVSSSNSWNSYCRNLVHPWSWNGEVGCYGRQVGVGTGRGVRYFIGWLGCGLPCCMTLDRTLVPNSDPIRWLRVTSLSFQEEEGIRSQRGRLVIPQETGHSDPGILRSSIKTLDIEFKYNFSGSETEVL